MLSTAGDAAIRAIPPQQKITNPPTLRPSPTTLTMVRKTIGLPKGMTGPTAPLSERKQIYLYVNHPLQADRFSNFIPNSQSRPTNESSTTPGTITQQLANTVPFPAPNSPSPSSEPPSFPPAMLSSASPSTSTNSTCAITWNVCMASVS